MEHLGHAILEGFVTDDVDITITKTGKPMTMFTLAIAHHRRPGEPARVSFVEVEIWEQLALDNIDNLKKGRKVRVEGKLRQDRWTENDKICSRICSGESSILTHEIWLRGVIIEATERSANVKTPPPRIVTGKQIGRASSRERVYRAV